MVLRQRPGMAGGERPSPTTTREKPLLEEEENDRTLGRSDDILSAKGPASQSVQKAMASETMIAPDTTTTVTRAVSYQVSTAFILRGMAGIYLVAFAGAYYQMMGLVGSSDSLVPVGPALRQHFHHQKQQQLHSEAATTTMNLFYTAGKLFTQHPSLGWFWMAYTTSTAKNSHSSSASSSVDQPHHLGDFQDEMFLQAVIQTGLVLSLAVGLLGIRSCWIQMMLWLGYFTVVTMGSWNSSFFSYGWESQILETGFLTIFLGALPHVEVYRVVPRPPYDPYKKNDNHVDQQHHYHHHTPGTWRRVRLRLALWQVASRPDPEPADLEPWYRTLWTAPQPPEPSWIILWLFQWLIFRISLGAGLIKMRGSSCWTQKTCLHHHFETQPLPSPLSFIYHFLPRSVQSRMVDTDLWVQLYTSWMVLFPNIWARRRSFSTSTTTTADTTTSCPAPSQPGDQVRRGGEASRDGHRRSAWCSLLGQGILWTLRIAGFLQAGFMVGILLSGNYSFLNHLTILPALACLDDACWPAWIRSWVTGLDDSAWTHRTDSPAPVLLRRHRHEIPWYRRLRVWLVDVPLLGLILYLSGPVMQNLLQWGDSHRRQLMNASFDNFRLVNTYGAFGSVGEARYEAIVQIGYYQRVPAKVNQSDSGDSPDLQRPQRRLVWKEVEFPCKPGNVYRRPCFCAPYHYRLDWNIWFLGFKPHQAYLRQREGWLYQLLAKMLQAGHPTTSRPWLPLLDSSTVKFLNERFYKRGRAPLYVKVDMYHYQMAAPLWQLLWQMYRTDRPVAWWKRQFEEVLIPPIGWNAQEQRLYLASVEESRS